VKVVYVVSQFPTVTQTFVLREMDGVAREPDMEVAVAALKPGGDSTVHAAAEKWMPFVRRGTPVRAITGLLWWLGVRPLRLLSSLLAVVRGYAREPALLARALMTFAIGTDLARALGDDADHLHAHFAAHPTLAAWTMHRLTGVPYSITVHAYDLFLSQAFLARDVHDARFVVAISEFNRRFLGDYGGDSVTPVSLVHCGIDPAAYPYRSRELPTEGPVRAICVASLQVHKGQSFLLRAMASGHPGLDRLHLRLVGDGPYRERLEALTAELALAARVTFLGSRPQEEVPALLDDSDLLVLPSIVGPDGNMEGLPVSLMEALAAGLPVVATRMSGVPELVRDPGTGYLAEPSDVDSLAGALARVLDDPPEAQARAAAGRRLVEAEFDIEDSAREMAQLFRTAG
jgi:glycosyltransferase involved in cell wall biosynthesis